MTTIICPNDECINNGGKRKGYKCQCKKISLKYRNMATVNEGRVDMWVCKSYEPDAEYKELDERINRFMESKRLELKAENE